MPLISPARRRRAALVGAACAALTGSVLAVPASADPSGALALNPSDTSLGGWTRLVDHPQGTVHRVTRAGGRVLRVSDGGRPAGYVMLGVRFAPRSAVVGRAEVNVARQVIGRGRARAIIEIGSAQGVSFEAGILRNRSGQLRWATWLKRRDGSRDALVVSPARVERRSWTTLTLATRWAGPGGRAALRVDGRVVARTPRVDLTGIGATRANVGLGTPGSRRELGLLYIRNAAAWGPDLPVAPAPEARDESPGGSGTPGDTGGPGGPAAIGGTGPSTTSPGTAPRRTTTPSTPRPASGPASPPPAPGTIPGTIFSTVDFESGSFRTRFGTLPYFGGISSYQAVDTDRIQSVPSPDGSGRVGRFEIRDGDNPVCCGERSEISIDTDDAEGQERWYTWATMFDESFPGGGLWQTVTQFHSQHDGQPPVGFYAENNVYRLQVWPKNRDGSSAGSPVTIWKTPIVRGKWYRIALHVKWSGSDDIGFVELFVDGQPAGAKTMIRTLYPGYTNYTKFGYYRDFGMSQTAVVYHDDFKASNVN